MEESERDPNRETCDEGWHTRDVVDEETGAVTNGERVSDADWTGHGETHHSCNLPPGHDGPHVCAWCGEVLP